MVVVTESKLESRRVGSASNARHEVETHVIVRRAQ